MRGILAYLVFIWRRGFSFVFLSSIAIGCGTEAGNRTPPSEVSVSPKVDTASIDTLPSHSLGTRLDNSDFVVAGLSEGNDSAAVAARLGRPDSISVEANQYDPGAKLFTWHYRAVDIGFVIATVQSFEIRGPGLGTVRGVRIGTTADTVKAAYGEPSNRYDEDWVYSDPKQDLHQITFRFKDGHVIMIFIGTVLD
jgi:hypothetical protein